MLSKTSNYILKTIKSAKISIKLTLVYAFMFSLVLLILNASILYGVKYYLYNQSNKQIDDMQTIILNKIKSQDEQLDLSDKDIFSEIPYKQNIFIWITQEDGEIINSSEKINYETKQIHDRIEHLKAKGKRLEDKEKHLVYRNTKFKSKKYGTIYVQMAKDMHSEYDFMKILFWVMAVADFLGIIASIIVGYMVSKKMLKPIY